MNIIPSSEEGVQKALEVLRSGGIVAHATETCYGLACDIQKPEAIDRLFAIKKRPNDLPVSALFASVDQVKHYLEWNEEASQMAAEHLPGPLTIILKKSPGCRLHVCPSGNDSIGMRVSPHVTAHALVKQFGSPLSTTSANIHGSPNTYSAKEVVDQFEEAELAPDLLLDDGILKKTDASTVVDVSEGVLHVLRKGNVAF